MSLLWRDRIQVFFAPDQINIVGMSRGIKPVQRFRQSSICMQNTDAVQWQAPLQLLEQMIGQIYDDSGSAGIRRGAELHVTLSNHFVRYGVIAPQPALANPDELMAFASFQMREIYGERINDWTLSLSTWDPCRGALCAAVALDLLAGFEALGQRYPIKLKQIEPYLATALDHWSRELDSKHLWFALIEPGRFCLTVLLDNQWRCVRNQRVVQNFEEELLAALEQEIIVLGPRESVKQVYVFAPELSEWKLTSDQGWQFLRLPDEGKRSAPVHFPLPGSADNRAEPCIA